MKPINSFGVVAFKKSPKVHAAVNRIIGWAEKARRPLFFHPVLAPRVGNSGSACGSEAELLAKSDVLVSVGGDGTFLSTVHLSRFSGKPVVGVNTGGLGFLTDIGLDTLEADFDRIAAGDFSTTTRMLLEARVLRDGADIKTMRALNDVFINRSDKPKLMSLRAWSGERYISEFVADGLIVASPSGSTAYSLAAGGPIVDPSVKALLLTPICPHSLTERPLILPCDRPVKIVVSQDSAETVLSADGLDNMRLKSGDEVLVTYCGDQTNLLQVSGRSHFDLLRLKLGWGKDHKSADTAEDM
jgi:NAD+ kinase